MKQAPILRRRFFSVGWKKERCMQGSTNAHSLCAPAALSKPFIAAAVLLFALFLLLPFIEAACRNNATTMFERASKRRLLLNAISTGIIEEVLGLFCL